MKKNLALVLCGSLLILGASAACSKAEKKAAANTTPIDQLIRAGKPPVVVGSLRRGLSPIAPTFAVSVTNASDCPVSLINGVVLFFDANGTLLPDGKKDMGYSDITPIEPGAGIELTTMTSNEKAVRGKWIIKEVIYKKMTQFKEYGAMPFKWTNKNFEAEVAAAEAGK